MPQVYRADHVGSLLRPPEVTEARAACQAGTLTGEQLSDIEDQGHPCGLWSASEALGSTSLPTVNFAAPCSRAIWRKRWKDLWQPSNPVLS